MKINDSKKISSYLYNQITDIRWKGLLNSFVNSSEFTDIIDELIASINEGYRITPKLKEIFNPFIYCPLEDLKVVMIKTEPFLNLYNNDGLAFSTPLGVQKPPALFTLHKNIAKNIYKGDRAIYELSSDLTTWAEQGILLLNASFTAEYQNEEMFFELWKPFTTYILDMLQIKAKNVVYVFFGEKAAEFEFLINTEQNLVLRLEEIKNALWKDEDMFNNINNYLKTNNKYKIIW